MANLNPTIVLVHGAWHDVSCWDGVATRLSSLSYPTVAVPLVSPGSKPAVKSHLEDVAVVRKQLEELIEKENKDVVLVMHSYAGLAGSGATEGLEKAARQQQGKKGGVAACLFISAFLVSKGMSLLGQFPQKPPYLIPDPNDEAFVLVDSFHDTFYNDLPKEASEPYIGKMRPHPVSTFLSEVQSTCWESGLIPCTYLFCEKDQGVFPFLQEIMLKNREADSPKPWKIVKVDASHSVWLSKPDVVVDLIDKIAKEE